LLQVIVFINATKVYMLGNFHIGFIGRSRSLNPISIEDGTPVYRSEQGVHGSLRSGVLKLIAIHGNGSTFLSE
jgi:hypothetical protein